MEPSLYDSVGGSDLDMKSIIKARQYDHHHNRRLLIATWGPCTEPPRGFLEKFLTEFYMMNRMPRTQRWSSGKFIRLKGGTDRLLFMLCLTLYRFLQPRLIPRNAKASHVERIVFVEPSFDLIIPLVIIAGACR